MIKKISFMLGVFVLFVGCSVQNDSLSTPDSKGAQSSKHAGEVITISFVGDNVLGDYYGSQGETLNWQFAQVKGDYGYFFARVKHVLESDDLSLGNLEGPLTTHSGDRLIKPFAFKGDPSYVKILQKGSIEAVNIANNHTRDCGVQGFEDTQKHLKNAGIYYSGEGILSLYEVKGIKIGMAGHRGWNPAIKPQVKSEIAKLRAMGADIVIFSFHWGEEREHYPNATQKDIAHFAIDHGADLIIGHHPHVLQGFEEYRGKKIIYSLGNFVYGGAKNPADKDTIIYQVRFAFDKDGEEKLKKIAKDSVYIKGLKALVQSKQGSLPDGSKQALEWSELHSFIPALISGEKTRNNYQPIIAPDSDKARIIKRLETYSGGIR